MGWLPDAGLAALTASSLRSFLSINQKQTEIEASLRRVCDAADATSPAVRSRLYATVVDGPSPPMVAVLNRLACEGDGSLPLCELRGLRPMCWAEWTAHIDRLSAAEELLIAERHPSLSRAPSAGSSCSSENSPICSPLGPATPEIPTSPSRPAHRGISAPASPVPPGTRRTASSAPVSPSAPATAGKPITVGRAPADGARSSTETPPPAASSVTTSPLSVLSETATCLQFELDELGRDRDLGGANAERRVEGDATPPPSQEVAATPSTADAMSAGATPPAADGAPGPAGPGPAGPVPAGPGPGAASTPFKRTMSSQQLFVALDCTGLNDFVRVRDVGKGTFGHAVLMESKSTGVQVVAKRIPMGGMSHESYRRLDNEASGNTASTITHPPMMALIAVSARR